MIPIQDGEAFALIAFESRSEVNLAPSELAPGIWVSSRSVIGLDEFWKAELGRARFRDFESCTVFLLAKGGNGSPFAGQSPKDRLWRCYSGILLSQRFGIEQVPFLIEGHGVGNGFDVNRVSPLDPAIHAAANRWYRLSNADVLRGLQIGQAIEIYPWAGAHRLHRVLSLYLNARTRLEWMDRIHQYTRCLDGLTVPPGGGTGKKFAERMTLLAGLTNQALFEEIYKIRGAIEHLRENDYTEPFSRAGRIDLVSQAGIVEYVARSALIRVLETPTLWPYFATKPSLEAFWALPDADRERLWGQAVDPKDGLIGFDAQHFSDQDLGGP
jgi:hypothetical protein